MIWNWRYAKTSCGTTIYMLCKDNDIERQSAKFVNKWLVTTMCNCANCKNNDLEQKRTNNDQEQQIAKKELEITKDANLQIQMAWSGITICNKKRSGATVSKFADGHPINECIKSFIAALILFIRAMSSTARQGKQNYSELKIRTNSA